ncbi:MAG: tyrosine-type recombinase/integrase [Planctomycetes bacterium]|nr:tyrosine-type recombinase/integrase [Planctomycetota bacterium]
MAKAGRKAQHYRDPDTGMVYNGLGRRPSKNGTPGRFYAINDRNKTFGADPKIAVAKFEAYQHQTRGERPLLVFGVDTAVQDIAGNGIQLSGSNGNGTLHTPDRETWDRILKVGDDYQRVPDELKPLIMGLQAHKEHWPQYAEERGLDPELPFEGYWPDYIYWLVGRWIKSEPDDAAQKLGIPQLKNIDAIEPPKPSLPLRELANLYLSKSVDPTICERRTTRRFMEFAKIVGVKTVKKISHEHIEQYGNSIHKDGRRRGHKPSWMGIRFNAIKTVFAYALKRGRDQSEIARVLLLLKMLAAPKDMTGSTAASVSREDLHALLGCADDRMRAMMLVGLNCAFYPCDLRRVPASAVDLENGYLVFPRTKIGKPIPRVAVLWERTIEAIRCYQSAHPHNAVDEQSGETLLFDGHKGERVKASTIRGFVAALRGMAGVPEFQFNQLRDGAYTAIIEAGIDITQGEILMGHSVGGVKDAYIERRPEIVRAACEAVEQHYFS